MKHPLKPLPVYTFLRIYVQCPEIRKLITELLSLIFSRFILPQYREAHREYPAKDLRLEVKEIETRIAKMMELRAQMENSAPALREVDTLERHRSVLDHRERG